MQKFSKKEALSVGWNIATSNILLILGAILFTWIVGIAFAFMSDALEDVSNILSIAVGVVSIGINMLLSMGLLFIAIRLVRKTETSFNDLFGQTSKIWKFIGANILYGLIILAGLILFIIPGIYFAIKYGFFRYLIVDKNMGIRESLKESARMTEGVKFDLVLIGIMFGLINILGVLAMGVGILLSIPVTMIAAAYVYDKLLIKNDAPSPQAQTSNEVPTPS